mgnify:CR=1 FL=1
MQSKYSLKRHLTKRLLAYIAIVLLCPVFVTLCITLKNKPKDVEKFSLFFIGDVKKDDIKSKVEALLPDVLEVKVNAYLETESIVTKLYDTEGATSDIVVMPITFFENYTKFPYVDLTGTHLSNDNNFKFYDYEFGLKCNDTYFVDYMNLASKEYFAFFKSDSVHLDEITSGKTNYIKTVLEGFKSA